MNALQFEKRLKQKIITVLNQGEGRSSLRLSTDYWPEGRSRKVAESIFQPKYQLGLLFPYKTCTTISFEDNEPSCGSNMNFKSPILLNSCFTVRILWNQKIAPQKRSNSQTF